VPPHNLREVIEGCIWLIEHAYLTASEGVEPGGEAARETGGGPAGGPGGGAGEGTGARAPSRAEKLEQLLRLIPGPDFPTAGYIVGRAGIIQAYTTGRGSILMRARTTLETSRKGDKISIVVTEIPYQVNKKKLIERIAELVQDKTIEGIS